MNKYLGQLTAFLTDENAEELNVIDFALLTFIRTFHGTLYGRMPGWKSHLLGSASSLMPWGRGQQSNQERRRDWERRLQTAGIGAEECGLTLDLLSNLFPALDGLTDARSYVQAFSNSATQGRRISSHSYFDRYFQFAVPENDISDSLVTRALEHLLEGADPGIEFDQVLERLAADSGLILSKVRMLAKGFRCAQPRAMMQLLGDQYSSVDRHDRWFMFSSPRDIVRDLAVELLERMESGPRDLEAAAIAGQAEMEFSIDIGLALSLDEALCRKPWVTRYMQVLDERFRIYIDQNYANLTDVEYADFGFFRKWGKIVDDGIARDLAQERINARSWDLEEYLAKITSSNYSVGVSNPVARLSDIDEAWIESFVGVDFALDRLGGRLDGRSVPLRHHEIENPTRQQRLDFVLDFLGEVKSSRERQDE